MNVGHSSVSCDQCGFGRLAEILKSAGHNQHGCCLIRALSSSVSRENLQIHTFL